MKKGLLTILVTFSIIYASGQGTIDFIENKGQWDSRVMFKGDVSNGAVFIRKNGITIVQQNSVDLAKVMHSRHGHDYAAAENRNSEPDIIRSHNWNVDFIGGSANCKVVPAKISSYQNNYYIGNDPTKWASGCRVFQVVTLENIYPNVDARYYTDNGTLKYDLIVKPGGDVSKIALRYDGIEGLKIKDKELVLSTSIGELKEGKPYTYQAGLSSRNEVNCKYVVNNNVVRFEIKKYDPNVTLVIDPSIVFCSFSGSSADNWGFTATYGPDGSMYGGGQVYGVGFPTTTGAAQTTFSGGTFDIGIIKLTPNGSSRVYATYLGGSTGGGLDQPHSLVVDDQGNLFAAGRSNSSNFPVINNGTLAGAGYDIVVFSLNGTGGLNASRKIGGSNDDGVNINAARTQSSLQQNYGDDGRSEIILDNAGNVYVASCTQSSNFPGTTGFFQTAFGGGSQDGVLLKLNSSLSSVLFTSYLGGTGNDAAYVLSIGSGGNIYVGGGTESGNLLQGTQGGTLGTVFNGNIDGFVAIINSAGTSVIRSTYIGTSGIDQVFGIQFDAKGFPYIMGQTTGSWQVVNNLPGGPAIYSNAGGKQFIAKLQPDLSAYVYSTMFGTGGAIPNISPVAFLVDKCENVYMSGWGGPGFGTGFSSAGTTDLPTTPDAFKSTTDGKDFYFFVLKKDAESQLYGTFFGENNGLNGGNDHVDGGTSRFDRTGTIYQAVCANCFINNPHPSFPVTPGAAYTVNNAYLSNNRAGCNLAMIKIAMNLAGVISGVQSAIDGVVRDTIGCVPQTVVFSDTIGNAQSYEWYIDYIPGNIPTQTTTTPTFTWTFNTVGLHRVMLVAVDSSTCNQRDSSFMNIKIGITRALPVFIYARQSPCDQFRYSFTNTTLEPPTHPFKDTSFVWDFGDGSPLVKTGYNNPPLTHQYAGPGTYFVKLLLNDTTYCNSPDDTTLRIDVALNVTAALSAPSIVCVNQSVQFTSSSTGAETYFWEFGDGFTSTDENPVHVYTSGGPFVVRLTVFNAGSCNKQDTKTLNITVYESPVAQAGFSPDPPVVNNPTVFTNSSLNAVQYKWFFGDGDSLITTSLQPVTHQYGATNTYNAMLIAYNQAGCTDTFPMTVRAIIEPVVGVPNAFTPLSGDENSVILVRGFGISKMLFTIWNRWGQKVFETNSQSVGWDGKVKGMLQPMDVYTFTLSAEFSDGQKVSKKGDITLIR
ncbi:MAG: PKD domain-containing protein [Chitinophagaceae bacterium]|nr:PKD domain-containing protein [Chitinophagaceae bacterium]